MGFLDENQGQGILQKLTEQDLFISRDGKQLADALGKGTHAIALGLSQRFVDPYINAGIPIKPLMPIKEGLSGSNGFGTVAVMKNAPHPNASKVYINWLLGKEGQDLYGKALTQGTRRFDVDTKWLATIDSSAAKDVMTPEQFEKVRFYGEDVTNGQSRSRLSPYASMRYPIVRGDDKRPIRFISGFFLRIDRLDHAIR